MKSKSRAAAIVMTLASLLPYSALAAGLDIEKFRLATREYSYLLGLKTAASLLATERRGEANSSTSEILLRKSLIERLARELESNLAHFSNPYILNELKQVIADLENAGSFMNQKTPAETRRDQLNLCQRIADRIKSLADLAAAEYQKQANPVTQFIEAAAQKPELLSPALKLALIQTIRQLEDERLLAEETAGKLQVQLRQADALLIEKQTAAHTLDHELATRQSRQAESEAELAASLKKFEQSLKKLDAEKDALRASQMQLNQALADLDAQSAQRKSSIEAKIPDLIRAAIALHSRGEVTTDIQGLAGLDNKTAAALKQGLTAEILSRVQNFKSLHKAGVKANIAVTAVILKEDVTKKGLFVESVDRVFTIALRVRVQQGVHSAEEELAQLRVSYFEKAALQISDRYLLGLDTDLSQSLSRMVNDAEIASLNTQTVEDAICAILLKTS